MERDLFPESSVPFLHKIVSVSWNAWNVLGCYFEKAGL
jgi:hypothetical protein